MFDLNILTQENELYAGKAAFLAADAIDGEIGILTGHAPLITVLGKGSVRFTLPDGEKREFNIDHGLLKVGNNQAAVLI